MPPSDSDCAWAAGFYDGEGCTTLSKARGHVSPKVCVTQKDLRPLRRFHQIVGCGNISRPGKSGVSTWSAGAQKDVLRVLDLLWPYLSEPKREQATSMLDQRTHRKTFALCAQPGHVLRTKKSGRPYCATCFNTYRKNWRDMRARETK